MKSAYELAMERLERQAPTHQLTPAQKSAIADIESVYKARIAERELLLKGEIDKAISAGKFDEVDSLQKQLAMDTRRLTDECETKKAKAREPA
jgi:hypothetical protein